MGKYYSLVHMLTCAHSLLSLPLPWPHMISLTTQSINTGPHTCQNGGPTRNPRHGHGHGHEPRGARFKPLAGREYALQYIQGPCCSSTVPPATYSNFALDAQMPDKGSSREGGGDRVAGQWGGSCYAGWKRYRHSSRKVLDTFGCSCS